MIRTATNAITWLIAMAIFATAGLAGGVALQTYRTTGHWQVPTYRDVGELARVLVRTTKPAPKVVYLHRGPIQLTGGTFDDATNNISSTVGRRGVDSVQLRGYRGSDAQWKRIVSCVRETFHPFDIEFVDERPTDDEYIMVALGRHPRDIGYGDHHVGGLSPFNGSVVHRAIVFAFTDSLQNKRRAICNTIAEEVGHAYGLDHTYECSDVMTYLPDCGPKYFRDRDMRCGEHEPRQCANDEPTQNTYRALADLVGLRE